MKEQRLSEILKEIRFALRLNQKEMGQTLDMGEKMYQLYESGQYDNKGTGSVKRQKLLDRIKLVKNKILIGSGANQQVKVTSQNDFAYQELEKKIAELEKENKELMLKLIALQEHSLRKTQKKIIYKSNN